jgi:hypothetical protein
MDSWRKHTSDEDNLYTPSVMSHKMMANFRFTNCVHCRTAAREVNKESPRMTTISLFLAAAVATGTTSAAASGSPARIWHSSSRRRFSHGVTSRSRH